MSMLLFVPSVVTFAFLSLIFPAPSVIPIFMYLLISLLYFHLCVQMDFFILRCHLTILRIQVCVICFGLGQVHNRPFIPCH